MKLFFGILRRELEHLLRAIESLNTDHGLQGYGRRHARGEDPSSR